MAAYWDHLKDPRWQKMRLEILERDEFRCQECSDKETELHVHHLYYVKGRKPWEYHPSELQTLCKWCHERATQALLKAAMMTGVQYEAGVEQITGYALALLLSQKIAPSVKVTYSECKGIGDFYGVPHELVWGHALEHERLVTDDEMNELHAWYMRGRTDG